MIGFNGNGARSKNGMAAAADNGETGGGAPWRDPILPTDIPTTTGPPRMPPELASGYPNRVAGCLLGKMCGDVLGAGVEGWAAEDILLSNPGGLCDFLNTERGFGCYTDDTQMAIALARSLVACGGRVDDVQAARSYAEEYHASRGYGGTAYKILSGIKRSGIDEVSIRTIGTKFIPNGSFGNGGAMRIAPLGLVYRHAPPAELREAVAAALRCTHVHPVAIDGAFVIALAVGYLATRQPGPPTDAAAAAATAAAASLPDGGRHHGTLGDASPASATGTAGSGWPAWPAGDGGGNGGSGVAAAAMPVATPVGLLDYLLAQGSHLETKEMAHKLRTVRAALLQATQFKAPGQSWADYFARPGWASELQLQSQIAKPFQIRADDAAAAALAALCWHWRAPEDAVVAAVHYGGDTDTLAAITGALVGSLYGTHWLPARWFSRLENGPAGRDEVVQLAAGLARLDARSGVGGDAAGREGGPGDAGRREEEEEEDAMDWDRA